MADSGLVGYEWTIQELWWARQARQRAAWDHTGAMLAMTHNINVTKECEAMKPDDFNPFRMAERETAPKGPTNCQGIEIHRLQNLAILLNH